MPQNGPCLLCRSNHTIRCCMLYWEHWEHWEQPLSSPYGPWKEMPTHIWKNAGHLSTHRGMEEIRFMHMHCIAKNTQPQSMVNVMTSVINPISGAKLFRTMQNTPWPGLSSVLTPLQWRLMSA